jgi:hypothetical protein
MLKRLDRGQFDEKSQLEIIDLIVERYKRRTAWHRAEKTLTLQGRAICRRLCDGDKTAANELFDKVSKLKEAKVESILAGFTAEAAELGLDDETISAVFEVHPILAARQFIEVCRERVEAELEMLVKKLPIADWLDHPDQMGVGAGSLAAILGSAGNLFTYVTVQKLWKRMGMAVMPNGRQRPMRDAEQAKLHGYSPQRRSVMWNIGTSILRTQSQRNEKDDDGEIVGVKREAGAYRRLYDERKAYESAKNDNGDYAEQAAKRLSEASFDKKTAAYKAYMEGKLPPLHLHARAQRFVEKRFLKELWVEWQKTMERPPVPAALLEEPEAASALADA